MRFNALSLDGFGVEVDFLALDQFIPVENIGIELFKLMQHAFAFFFHPQRMVKGNERSAVFGYLLARLKKQKRDGAMIELKANGFFTQLFNLEAKLSD